MRSGAQEERESVSRTALVTLIQRGPKRQGPWRGSATLQRAGQIENGEEESPTRSVLSRVFGRPSVQVNFQGLFFAGGVADPMARL